MDDAAVLIASLHTKIKGIRVCGCTTNCVFTSARGCGVMRSSSRQKDTLATAVTEEILSVESPSMHDG